MVRCSLFLIGSSNKLVSDAEGPYLNCPFLSGSPFPTPTLRPAKLVTWQPMIPNGRNPIYVQLAQFTPGANDTLQKVCRRYGYLSAQIGLGWGRQNERDGVMVKDPPIDLEEAH